MNKFLKRLELKIGYALKGLRYVWRRELSFQVEAVFVLVLIGYAYYAAWPLWKWLVLVCLAVIVLFAEIVNTILERLLDLFEPRLSPPVAQLKDVLAGAVLWLVFGTLLVVILLIAV